MTLRNDAVGAAFVTRVLPAVRSRRGGPRDCGNDGLASEAVDDRMSWLHNCNVLIIRTLRQDKFPIFVIDSLSEIQEAV